jgi:hypothetical protein
MIVATARILDGTLITFDSKILKYGKQGNVKILSPKKY